MSAVPEPMPGDSPEIPPIPLGIRRSMEAYWRDLPQLLPLKSRTRQWVAYHGDERVAFGPTQHELYQECYRRGIDGDEVYIGRLEPDHLPPWEPIDLDSFAEGTEDGATNFLPEPPP
jgi:hypothetical protein